MAIRKIAFIGHPVLRVPARAVSREELARDATQQLIDDLVETMRDANGAGLAAPQIHESVRICALEVQNNPRYPYKPNIPLTILVNPQIEVVGAETFENYEGCLSVPNLRGRVERHAEIVVRAWDRHGAPIETRARGFTAGVYQHEIDHLDATVFVDRVKDPLSFTTWTDFERYHREAWLEEAAKVVARFAQ